MIDLGKNIQGSVRNTVYLSVEDDIWVAIERDHAIWDSVSFEVRNPIEGSIKRMALGDLRRVIGVRRIFG